MQGGSGMFQGELKIQRGCPYGLKVIDDRRDAQRWEFMYKKKIYLKSCFSSWSRSCFLTFFLVESVTSFFVLEPYFFFVESLISFFSSIFLLQIPIPGPRIL